MPGLPSRGRRQPVAAGRAGRQIAAHGPRRSTAPATTRRRSPRSPATSSAGGWPSWPARPRGGRSARRDRRRRAAAVVAAVAGVAVGELAPARDALLTAGLLGPDGERLAHGLVGGRGRGGPRRDRMRAHASRGRARADRAPTPTPSSSPGTCCSAGPQADPDVERAAGAGRGDRGAPRGAAHRRRVPRARAARSTRRATTAGACSPSWRRSPSTPACRTRSAVCSMRCPRCAIARAASTCSRAWRRSTCSAPATPITPSCSSASWPVRPTPTRGWRSRPRRSTRC